MAAVWYIGTSTERIISSGTWLDLGVEAPDSVWNSANGWSIPAASFTVGQLFVLTQDAGFWTTAPDGPRDWELVEPGPGSPVEGEGPTMLEQMTDIVKRELEKTIAYSIVL